MSSWSIRRSSVFSLGILAGAALVGNGHPAAGQMVMLGTIFLSLTVAFMTAQPRS